MVGKWDGALGRRKESLTGIFKQQTRPQVSGRGEVQGMCNLFTNQRPLDYQLCCQIVAVALRAHIHSSFYFFHVFIGILHFYSQQQVRQRLFNFADEKTETQEEKKKRKPTCPKMLYRGPNTGDNSLAMGQGPTLTLSQAARRSSNLPLVQRSLFSFLSSSPLQLSSNVISVLALTDSQKRVTKLCSLEGSNCNLCGMMMKKCFCPAISLFLWLRLSMLAYSDTKSI